MERNVNEQEVIIFNSLHNEDGSINNTKLKQYIKDSVESQRNSSVVYETITKGLLNHSHYSSETVLSVYDTIQKNLIDKDKACEDILQIVSDEDTKQLIIEYFGSNDKWAKN